MKTPEAIDFSDGSSIKAPVVLIEDDWHEERSGFYRAFWAAAPDADTMVTAFGYCSAGGSYRTIRRTVAHLRLSYPDAKVYRNGRLIS